MRQFIWVPTAIRGTWRSIHSKVDHKSSIQCSRCSERKCLWDRSWLTGDRVIIFCCKLKFLAIKSCPRWWWSPVRVQKMLLWGPSLMEKLWLNIDWFLHCVLKRFECERNLWFLLGEESPDKITLGKGHYCFFYGQGSQGGFDIILNLTKRILKEIAFNWPQISIIKSDFHSTK